MLYPGETVEPDTQFMDERKLQQVRDIIVTGPGLAALADSKRIRSPQRRSTSSTQRLGNSPSAI